MTNNQILGATVAAYAAMVTYGVYQNYKFEKELKDAQQTLADSEADLHDRLQNLRTRMSNPRAYAAQHRDLKVEVIEISRN